MLEPLRVVIVGHIDHGKSTLVGRLIYEMGSLPDGKFEAIKAVCERRGISFEWAFLMNAFQSERDQGITIDTAQIWLRSKTRDCVIIDAPSHREFIKNMITGAASAEAAMLMIDASHGIQQQSCLHGFLLNLLGIRQVAVVVNKMNLVGYSGSHFEEIRRTYDPYLSGFGARADYVRAGLGARGREPRPPRGFDAMVRGTDPDRDAEDLPARALAGRSAAAPAGAGRLQVQRPAHHRRAGRERPSGGGRPDRLLPQQQERVVKSIEGWSRPVPAL